ncbi:type-2 angiotensin II receptor [Gastrophryne carolinensis]
MAVNLTSNLTSKAPCINTTLADYQLDLLPVFYSFIFIFGFIGNSLVITVFCCQRELKTVASVYILNLALADLLFLITLPFWATYYAFGLNWMFGTEMCKISSALVNLNLFASILFISCMSIDRYMAIVYPLRSQRRTLHQAAIVALSVWAMAIISTLPTFYFRNTYYIKDLNVLACIMDFPTQEYSRWCSALALIKVVFGFCLPLSVILICYVKIGLHLRRSKGSVLNIQSRDRVLKIVTAIVVSFLVCWLPFHVLTFLDALIRMEIIIDCKMETMVELGMPLSICLGFSNSCINPLLYSFVGNQFRENFWNVFGSIKLLHNTDSQQNSSRKGSDCRAQSPSGSKDNSPA